MTDILPTYEDHLREIGGDCTQQFSCPKCKGGPFPAFALVESSTDPAHDFICSNCHISAMQHEKTVAEQQERLARAQADPWDSEEGATIRAVRNIKIDQWNWAVNPYTSPLIEAARQRAGDYIRTLHRITVDFTTPQNVVWPTEPTFESSDYT